MKPRQVPVRLRRATMHVLNIVAAERWEPVAVVCRDALAMHLRMETPVRIGRVPMPLGDDVTVPIPQELWLEAKRFADRADITIGQLCRLAAESYARSWPASRRAAS